MPSFTDQQNIILVSACLTGECCRYDGGSSLRDEIRRLAQTGNTLAVCPEQLGGLPTPRIPATIVGGDGDDVLDGRARVVDREGTDVTDHFVRGAHVALEMARQAGATRALLKASSPSCGCRSTNIDTRKSPGRGVAAAHLARAGIEIEEMD